MKKFLYHHLESIVIVSWGLYWLIVLVRQALGKTILPIHDGIFGLIATLLTMIYLFVSQPKQDNLSNDKPFPLWIIFVLLQATLIFQIHQNLPFITTILFISISIFIMIFGTFSLYSQTIPFKKWYVFNTFCESYYHRFDQGVRKGAFFLAAMFLIIPWGTYLLSQINIPLFGGMIISVMLCIILILNIPLDQSTTAIEKDVSIQSIVSPTIRQRFFQMIFFCISVAIGATGYLIIQEWGSTATVSDNAESIYIRPNLTQISRNWKINPDQYALAISTGSPQRLEFSFISPASGLAYIELAVIIQSEAGGFEARLIENGSVILSRKFESLQCQKWFINSSLEGRIRSDCQPIVDNFTLFESEVISGKEYIIVIETLPYSGPLTFTANGEIRQGEVIIGPPHTFLNPNE